MKPDDARSIDGGDLRKGSSGRSRQGKESDVILKESLLSPCKAAAGRFNQRIKAFPDRWTLQRLAYRCLADGDVTRRGQTPEDYPGKTEPSAFRRSKVQVQMYPATSDRRKGSPEPPVVTKSSALNHEHPRRDGAEPPAH